MQRIGIGIHDHQLDRLRDICKQAGTTQNGLFAAMASVLSASEAKSILARYEQLRLMEGVIRQTADKNLLSYIRGRSVEELESMVLAAKTA